MYTDASSAGNHSTVTMNPKRKKQKQRNRNSRRHNAVAGKAGVPLPEPPLPPSPRDPGASIAVSLRIIRGEAKSPSEALALLEQMLPSEFEKNKASYEAAFSVVYANPSP